MTVKILIYIILLFHIFLLFNCGSDPIRKVTFDYKKDSMQKKNYFDSVICVADFIIKSGGQLTTKEAAAVYYADTTLIGNLVNLGSVQLKEGKILESLNSFNRALLRDSSYSPPIYLYKGIAWHILKNKDSSYYYYNKAIILDSTNVEFLFLRAESYYQDSLYQKSINDITKALKIQPNNLNLNYTRGVYRMRLLNFKGASIDMKELPLNKKKDYRAYLNRAVIALKLGWYNECITQCNLSIALNPNNWEIYRYRASAKSGLGDFAGAYEDLKIAVSLGDTGESSAALKEYEKFYRTHKQI